MKEESVYIVLFRFGWFSKESFIGAKGSVSDSPTDTLCVHLVGLNTQIAFGCTLVAAAKHQRWGLPGPCGGGLFNGSAAFCNMEFYVRDKRVLS